MLFTMPPSYYTTQAIPTPATLPPIPIFDDDNDDIENVPVTESADSLSTVTPKAKFYVISSQITISLTRKKFSTKINLEFQLRLAALNEPYSGNLHGTRGADFSCYRQAVRAGIVGSFKAFLSTR